MGDASDGDTWTKSKDATLADSSATENATRPCFSPLEPMSITSLALIFSLIGVIFFF